MPESASQRVTRAYRRGYIDALQQATDDAKSRGNIGKECGLSLEAYLKYRADKVERDGVLGKATP